MGRGSRSAKMDPETASLTGTGRDEAAWGCVPQALTHDQACPSGPPPTLPCPSHPSTAHLEPVVVLKEVVPDTPSALGGRVRAAQQGTKQGRARDARHPSAGAGPGGGGGGHGVGRGVRVPKLERRGW